MKNKVYYGEYTLKHWIKLMLTRDIVLPEYQRHFVWQERDVKRLIQSLKEGQFVQPVTIALYNDGTNKSNLILDGQQRLTSLLLAFIGYFPDKKKFESPEITQLAREDDSQEEMSQQESSGILWQYPELLQYGNDKYTIVDEIHKDGRYIQLTDELFRGLDDDFFNNTFLGFSYVVPETTDLTEVQKGFSQLFRNINYFGKRLDVMESRKSLYYQNSSLTLYFEGICEDNSDVLNDLMIIEDLQPCKIDFVRYLSILSQYMFSARPDASDVLVGYSAYSSREAYYADYVSYVLGIDQEDRTKKFDSFHFTEVFPNDAWKSRFVVLKNALSSLKTDMTLKDEKSFSAGYEADYWIFGLMYHILFKGSTLKDDLHRLKQGKITSLSEELNARIRKDKRDPNFPKNTNRLTYLRTRLVESCKIVGYYVQE